MITVSYIDIFLDLYYMVDNVF